MDEKLFIPILLGTRLWGSQSGRVAQWLLEQSKKQILIETELFDTSQFNFPGHLAGEAMKPLNQFWQQAMERADGLIIVSPEYNHSFPGTLKLALDTLYEEYRHKVVAICGVSSGILGGVRMIENLLPILRDLNLIISNQDLRFGPVEELFDEKDRIQNQTYFQKTDKFFKQLIFLAQAMRGARANDQRNSNR